MRATRNGRQQTNGQAPEPLAPFENGHRNPQTGQFAKGNPGGPGNPAARRAVQLKQAFLAAATPQKLLQLAEKLLEQALAGDVTAASLFLAYSLGKPKSEPDADRLDLDELDILRKGPNREQLQALLLSVLSPAVVATFVREMLSGCHRHYADELAAIKPDLGTFFREAAGLEATESTDEQT
jgi:hypothetical protein